MRDNRVRIRIHPDARTFREVMAAAWRSMLRGIKAAAHALRYFIRDVLNPPSPERLWIRERGRAEMAEAQLWFARHIAAGAA